MGSPAPVYTLGFRAPLGRAGNRHRHPSCGTRLLTEGHHERQRVFRGSACAGGDCRSRSSAGAPDRRHLLSASDVHAHRGAPALVGALAVVTVVVSLVTFAFLSTEAGQTAWLDQQVRQREAFGRPVDARAVRAAREDRAVWSATSAAACTLVLVPIMTMVLSGHPARRLQRAARRLGDLQAGARRS